MDDFLRKMQLSEQAIEIYLKSLGKFPLSYYELYTITPNATPEEFKEKLNELMNAGLLLLQSTEKLQNIEQYLPLPPILPIINYYENINASLADIKNSIRELMINSVNKIFQESSIINLEDLINSFEEIKKDINEDAIIQKQEVEDIVEGMEELHTVKEKLSDFHQKIVNVFQTKFADLNKILNALKKDLIEGINSLDFKKHKEEIITLIEQVFKEKFEHILGDFTNNLYELIENKFEETGKPLENTTDLIIQYQNDFKMLLLNMLSNFEAKMNGIYDIIKENQNNYSVNIQNFEMSLADNLNSIIQNSVDEISHLNKPIEIVMANYLKKLNLINKDLFKNIWIIESVTKINEIIQNFIVNSEESLTIIIPHIENHLAEEQFEEISSNLKVKIAASEAHTNSVVKRIKSISTLMYRTFQNEDLIVLKSDNNQLIIGIILDSNDIMNDFIGCAVTFEPLIKILNPILNSIWENAYPDTYHTTQVTVEKTPRTLTSVKPIVKAKVQSAKLVQKPPQEIEIEKTKPKVTVPPQIQEIPKVDKRYIKNIKIETTIPSSIKPQNTGLKQKLREKINFVSAVKPKAGDDVAVEIKSAFDNLIQRLDSLKGDQFGNELQNIADLILEKKGFSITLHKIRSIINKFKEKLSLLDQNDKKEIIEEIESWKQKLF